MNNCSWCDKEIIGKGEFETFRSPVVWGDGKVEVEMTACEHLIFCCGGCHWAYQVDFHRLMGLSGKETRSHLLVEHEISPGKAGGHQCRVAWERSASIAEVLAEGLFNYRRGSDN